MKLQYQNFCKPTNTTILNEKINCIYDFCQKMFVSKYSNDFQIFYIINHNLIRQFFACKRLKVFTNFKFASFIKFFFQMNWMSRQVMQDKTNFIVTTFQYMAQLILISLLKVIFNNLIDNSYLLSLLCLI